MGSLDLLRWTVDPMTLAPADLAMRWSLIVSLGLLVLSAVSCGLVDLSAVVFRFALGGVGKSGAWLGLL